MSRFVLSARVLLRRYDELQRDRVCSGRFDDSREAIAETRPTRANSNNERSSERRNEYSDQTSRSRDEKRRELELFWIFARDSSDLVLHQTGDERDRWRLDVDRNGSQRSTTSNNSDDEDRVNDDDYARSLKTLRRNSRRNDRANRTIVSTQSIADTW